MRSDAAARGGVAEVPAPAAPTLTKRASPNARRSLRDYGARLGVGLVVTPIVVVGLGRSLFGEPDARPGAVVEPRLQGVERSPLRQRRGRGGGYLRDASARGGVTAHGRSRRRPRARA